MTQDAPLDQKALEVLVEAYVDARIAAKDSNVDTYMGAAKRVDAARAALRDALSRRVPASWEHPDDLAVDRFAAAMKEKLAKKRVEGRGGWENKDECSAEFLSELLRGHVEKGDPLDVGNLAMMLHQRGERIAAIVAAPEGWRTVPVEPTPEMTEAGWPMAFDEKGPQNINAAYRAMLAAAPPIPEGKAEPQP